MDKETEDKIEKEKREIKEILEKGGHLSEKDAEGIYSTKEPTEVMRIRITPQNSIRIKSEKGFWQNPGAENGAAPIRDIRGLGWLWLDSENGEPVVCLETPTGLMAVLDVALAARELFGSVNDWIKTAQTQGN